MINSNGMPGKRAVLTPGKKQPKVGTGPKMEDHSKHTVVTPKKRN